MSESLDEKMDQIREMIEDYPTFTLNERRFIWKQIALADAETVHHFMHGKKHGAHFEDCDIPTCQAITRLIEVEGLGIL